MMFYWLDNFTQCLPTFFHQGMGSNLTSFTVFNIYFTLIFNQMSRRANGLARHNQ
jgi:hypothetical protein